MPAGTFLRASLLFALAVNNCPYFGGREAVFLIAEMALNLSEVLLRHFFKLAVFE